MVAVISVLMGLSLTLLVGKDPRQEDLVVSGLPAVLDL